MTQYFGLVSKRFEKNSDIQYRMAHLYEQLLKQIIQFFCYLLYNLQNNEMSNNSQNQFEEVCVRCQNNQQFFISLNCEHNFCLVCMSYIVIKSRANGGNEDQVSCPVCNEFTKLKPDSLQAINTTIQETLLPKLNSYKQPIQQLSAENINQQNYEQVRSTLNQLKNNNQNQRDKKDPRQKKISNDEIKTKGVKGGKRYSEEHSFDHITPSTKYFFSKCDSPIQKQKNKHKEYCCVHPFEQLTFVCLSCKNQILCLKCIVNAKHKSHNIKNINKGIDQLTEQISMKKLEVNQKIEYYEMWSRRLTDKKAIIKQKWIKTKEQITQNFQQIIIKLKKKQNQIAETCNSHYQNIQNTIKKELEKLEINLHTLRNFRNDFKKLGNAEKEKPSQFFFFFNKLSNTLNSNVISDYQPGHNLNIDSSAILHEKDFLPLIDDINKIHLNINHKTNQATRLPTNLSSINSSRDKKNKKYSKTQEDETFQCGLTRKTQNNIQTTQKLTKKKNSKPNQLPVYVTKFFDKQNIKPAEKDLEKSSLMFEINAPKLNSSKMSSSKLLSKTIVLDDLQKKKKKEIVEQPKVKIQRKTTNPLESLKTQKTIFETKKKKIIN